MNEQSTRRSMTFLLSVWKEAQGDILTLWHGSLKTAAGQAWTFETLAELEILLCEIGGWMDPPADKDAEAKEIP